MPDPFDPPFDLLPCDRGNCVKVREALDRARTRIRALESGEVLPRHILFTLARAQAAFAADDYTGLGTIEGHIQPVVDAAIARINQIKQDARKREQGLQAELDHLSVLVQGGMAQIQQVFEIQAEIRDLIKNSPEWTYVPQDIAAEMFILLNRAGYGHGPYGNTLLGMVQEAATEAPPPCPDTTHLTR